MFLLLRCIDYDNQQPIMLMHGNNYGQMQFTRLISTCV